MQRRTHSWDLQHHHAFRRFALGCSAALSLTLVAFEWRSNAATYHLPSDPIDDRWLEDELPPVVIIKAEDRTTAPVRQRGRPVATNTPVLNDPIVEPVADPLVDAASMGTEAGPATSHALLATDSADAGPMMLNGVERQPYFLECLEGGILDLGHCTEARIDAHLQRHFRVPRDLRREEFTVVNLEVRKDGQIGRIHCAPRPSTEVQQELERVLRNLPVFVPGSQNGHPVAVIYQLPFRVARR
ncbi:MAG: hypothetical protein R2817_13765 [Flavobacteriales bacterium]